MSPLPLPVRLAAGLVATAVEQARDLPRLVVELPVTAVSQALQASMRVQQKVTELAIKGDLALGALRPVEESPGWATFDDEQESPRRNGSVTTLRPSRRPAATPDRGPDPVERLTDPVEEQLDEAAERESTAGTADTAAPQLPAADEPVAALPTAEPASTGPNVLPRYEELTIPQLRAKLRTFTADDLHALLTWEQEHRRRPPFLTMLSNRITTVTEG